MKILKGFLVFIITASLSFPPSLTSRVFAYYDPSDDDTEQAMPEYNEPFQTPQEAVKLPEEEPEAEPLEPEPILNSAGDTINLNNGVELTEQDDGTFRDEDGNKWVKVEGEDGKESYRQLGFPAGYEIKVTRSDDTEVVLESTTAFELTEDGKFADGVIFNDEEGNRWVTHGGQIHQKDYQAGSTIKLSDETVLTADAAFVANDDGTFPAGVKFTDNKGDKWVSAADGKFSKVGFAAGYEVKVTKADGTEVTLKSEKSFELTAEGKLPDGVIFRDGQNNRWVTHNDQILQKDYPAQSAIKLSDGTILKNDTAFVANDDGSLPAGVKFTDDKGNKWVSAADGKFNQTGFTTGKAISLSNGYTLTNDMPYDLGADGSIPAGILFTDQNGYKWISTGNNQFSVFNTNTTPVSSLPVVAQLQAMNPADAAALLSTFEPTTAALILFATQKTQSYENYRFVTTTSGVFTDQQITDILKAMDKDSAAAMLSSAYIDPVRCATILAAMDQAELIDIFSSEKMSASRAAVLLTQYKAKADADSRYLPALQRNESIFSAAQVSAILQGVDSGKAAKIISAVHYVSATPLVHKELNPNYGSDNGSTNNPLNINFTDDQKIRISIIRSALAGMDAAKAAAVIASSEMSLTVAAKALLGLNPSSTVTDYETWTVVVNDPRGKILAELEKLDPSRAKNVKEVLQYYKDLKAVPAYAWMTPTPEQNYWAAMEAIVRPLTADEKVLYTTMFGATPIHMKEFVFNGELGTSFWTTGAFASGSLQGLVGSINQKISGGELQAAAISTYDPYRGGEGVDLTAKLSGLPAEDAAKMLNNFNQATIASVIADPRISVDNAAGILGKLGTEQSAAVLSKMDAVNNVKANDIRVKLGIPVVPQASYNCATFSLGELLSGKDLWEINTALKPYTQNGLTSLFGIKEAANDFGLDMEAVKTTFPNLVNDTDAIAHFSRGHYVKMVSYDEASGMVTYKDNGEIKTVTRAEFEKEFSGYALVKKSKADPDEILTDAQAAEIFGSESDEGSGDDSGESLGAQGLLSPSELRSLDASGTPQWSSSNTNGGAPMGGLVRTSDGGSAAVSFSGGTTASLVRISSDVEKSLSKIGFNPTVGLKIDPSWNLSAQQAGAVGLKGVQDNSGNRYLVAQNWKPAAPSASQNTAVNQNTTIDPAKRAQLELALKLRASQAGGDIKAIVSSSGTTYLQYVRDDNGNVVGENVYSFEYDDNDNITGADVKQYVYEDGERVAVGGSQQDAQQSSGTITPVPGVENVWFTGEIGRLEQPQTQGQDQPAWTDEILRIVGSVTNPILEDITGVKAGSDEAKEWGSGVYQWTGGVFNVPMTVLFGRSLSDPYATDTMDIYERGQYLWEHPLELAEYGIAVYGGAGLVNNLLTRGAGVTSGAAASGWLTNPIGSALGTVRPIAIYGGAAGALGYEQTKLSGLSADESGQIVDAQGNPVMVDGLSAYVMGMGARWDNIFTGDESSKQFADAIAGQSMPAMISELTDTYGRNDDGTVNWANQAVLIVPQFVGGVLSFAEFPVTAVDEMAYATRKDGIEAGGAAGLKSGWGVVSYLGDVFIAAPANIGVSLVDGKGQVFYSGQLGNQAAEAVGLDWLSSGSPEFNQATPEYPHLAFFASNAALTIGGGKEAAHRSKGFEGMANKVIDTALIPVNVVPQGLGMLYNQAKTGARGIASRFNEAKKSSFNEAVPAGAGIFERGIRSELVSENSEIKGLSSTEVTELSVKLAAAEYGNQAQVLKDYLAEKNIVVSDARAESIVANAMGGPTEMQVRGAEQAAIDKKKSERTRLENLAESLDRSLNTERGEQNFQEKVQRLDEIRSMIKALDTEIAGLEQGAARRQIPSIASDLIKQRYNQLRKGSYTQEASENTNIDSFFGKSRTNEAGETTVFAANQEGWWWRFPTAKDKQPANDAIKYRVSINALAHPELVAKLDSFFLENDVQGYYKGSQDFKAWSSRHDPITMYFSKELTDGQKAQLAEITKGHTRVSATEALLGEAIAPGVTVDREYDRAEAQALIQEAKNIDPALGEAVENQIGRLASRGQVEAAADVVDYYEVALRGMPREWVANYDKVDMLVKINQVLNPAQTKTSAPEQSAVKIFDNVQLSSAISQESRGELNYLGKKITTEFSGFENFKEEMGLIVGVKQGDTYMITKVIPFNEFVSGQTKNDYLVPDKEAIKQIIDTQLLPDEIILGSVHNHSHERLLSNARPGPSAEDIEGLADTLNIPGYENRIARDKLGLVVEVECRTNELTEAQLENFDPAQAKVFLYSWMTTKIGEETDFKMLGIKELNRILR